MKDISNVRRASVRSRLKRSLPLYLMFLPGALYLILNNYIPMAGLIIPFLQSTGVRGS